MQMHGDIVYGRMGGQFFSAKKGEWQKKSPIGVVALNKANGNTNWIYTGANESITNMVVLPNDNVLLIADKSNLIGLGYVESGQSQRSLQSKTEIQTRTRRGAMSAAKRRQSRSAASAARSKKARNAPTIRFRSFDRKTARSSCAVCSICSRLIRRRKIFRGQTNTPRPESAVGNRS